MRWLWIVLITGGLLPSAGAEGNPKWKSIQVDQHKFIFRAEQLDLKLTKSARLTRDDYRSVSYSMYGKNSGRSRFALILRHSAGTGMGFTNAPAHYTRSWTKRAVLKNKNVVWSRKERFAGPFGVAKVQFSTIDVRGSIKRHCMHWILFTKGTGDRHDMYQDVVLTLYCQSGSIDNSIARSIVGLLGFKGGYIPPRSSENTILEKQVDSQETKVFKGGTGESRSGAWQSVTMAASWDSKEDLLLGVLKYQNNGNEGTGLLEVSSGTVSCKGRWQFVSGKYGSGNSPTGTWSIACNDGTAASGTYINDKIGSGRGKGLDANGNAVKITYGSN